MSTINTSPYLGYININPNKEYYVAEYYIKDDDFLGKLTIKLDRPANIYIFPTRFDQQTGLYVSDGSSLFKQTDYDYSFEAQISEKKDAKFIIILEYDGMVLGVNTPLKPNIVFKKSQLGEIYHSDFYMFETRSGIPYPAHDIGTYSRYEFDIQQTHQTYSYKRTGLIYNITTGSDNTVTSANVRQHCKTFVQGIMGFDHRPVVLEQFSVAVSGTTIGAAVVANASLISDKITQNKVILLAEEAYTKTTNEIPYIKILQKIMDERNYNTTKQLVADLMDIAYDYTATLIRYAEKLEDLINDTTLIAKVTQFINATFSTTTDDPTLTSLGMSLGFLRETEAITTVVSNGMLTTSKYLNEMLAAPVVSGRIDLSGQSQYTGKYASSKILVGHYHENERGYLKHTVATDRYGKTHKDPFVKNKELWGKEEDYIYLDLLHSTKNIFANSNKIMRGVALVTDKQFKDPPRGTIKFRFLDEDEYKANGSIVEVIEDYIIDNVYSAVYRAEKILEILGASNEELFYVLTNKSDFMKLFVRNEGDTEEYIFWYSQRVGTYKYSFVDGEGNTIQDDFIVTNKATNAYEAPSYIYSPPLSVDVPVHERVYYKLVKPKGVQYSAARWKGDYFHITFEYELITANFTFNLIDGDTDELLPFDNNTVLTLAGVEVNATSATPPQNENPVKYTGVTTLTYTPPSHIKLDDLHKYKTTTGTFLNLVATEINPVVENNIKYELIRSKFIYQFMDEQDNSLINSVTFEKSISAEYTAPLVLHTDTMAEDEYYILEDAPTILDSYPYYMDLTGYPTVKLQSDENQPNITFIFRYKRLKGTVKLNFISSEGTGPIDVTGYNSTMIFADIASLTVSDIGSNSLTGLIRRYVIPKELQANRNKTWKLFETITPANQKFIITPTQREIIFNFQYEPVRTYPEVLFILSSTCEQRTYTKYLLLDDNDTIVGKWDLASPSYQLNPPNGLNGLTVNLTKRVLRNGAEVALTNVMPLDIAPNIEITADAESSDHANEYDARLEGSFIFNTTVLSNKRYRLVGFINFPGSGSQGLHGSGHKIFDLKYANPVLSGTYGSFNPTDFIRQGINFTSNQLNVGQQFKVVDGTVVRGKVFMEIDLSKELDEEVFLISGVTTGSSFTVS